MRLGKLLDVFLQSNCPLCGRSSASIICVDCDRQITACRFQDSQQLPPDRSLSVPLFSWGVYDGALKRAIAACKYEHHPEIAEVLGEKIGEAWLKSSNARGTKPTVIPIPMHAEKLKTRGFNQAEILARSFCQVTKLPCMPKLLQRVKSTKPQIETKSKQERLENLAKAFAVPDSVRLKSSVILLDDIYTSGTTIREAIATLATAKIEVNSAIVLARPKLYTGKD
ncbi:ComF family protein [Tumidithrix elongata RA019]|uniref:ComF family protein n=1 Tax=Tumidithrix elongata BACA0141 TaxID=2716417 RepID=A0AAW9Q1R9_9CYAN|nr:ComF family protein [Tumidithrix elongata RA019]